MRRRFGAVTFALAYRLSLKQFRDLASGTSPYQGRVIGGAVVGAVRRRGAIASRLAVTVFALGFYVLIGAMAVAGGWLIWFQFPSPTLIPGGLLLLMALYLVPRFGRLPKHAIVLERADVPTLYAVVDRIAVAAGSRPPSLIVVDPWFNANARSIGLRRRRVLTLGLSLWGALSPAQRVGLIGHELAHFSNGDVRRGVLVQPCLTTLGRLSDLFGGRGGTFAGRSAIGVFQPIADFLMRVIAAGFFLAHLGVLAVTLRDGQRAEYLADQRAAALAGTRAMVEVLDLLDGNVDSVIASRARGQGLQDSWREAAQESLRANAPARNRLRQLSSRTSASLWSTHPSLGLRAWLVEGAAWREPTFVISPEESDRIDTELARHYREARLAIAHSRI